MDSKKLRGAILHGERVTLRAIEGRDVKTLVQFAQDPEMAPNLAFFSGAPPSVTQEAKWVLGMRRKMFAKDIRGLTDWVFAVESSDGELIGTVGLHEIDHKNHNARVGLLIANRTFRGKGYAAEILTTLYDFVFGIVGLHKVYVNFRVDNVKQRALSERLGFREVGILEEEYFWKGKFLDFVRYELLAREWLAERNFRGQ